MCGIFGILFQEKNETMSTEICNGLRRILNRGYDSIGISILQPDTIIKTCRHGTSDPLDHVFRKLAVVGSGMCAMSHTRWATHGEVSERNCHPHCAGDFILIHNGIVENQRVFDEALQSAHRTCISDTDSERIVQMIHLDHTIAKHKDVLSCVRRVLSTINGGYAVVLQDKNTPDILYCSRRHNPLLVGARPDGTLLVCSEKSGLIGCTDIYEVQQECVVRLQSGVSLKNIDGLTHISSQECSLLVSLEDNHTDDFTERELLEQPLLWDRIINKRLSQSSISFQEIPDNTREKILGHRHLFLVGCGTSYNTAVSAVQWFRRLNVFDTIQAHNAVDFDVGLIPRSRTVWILISQSGETIDLYVLLKKIPKEHTCIGLVNVMGSLLWRECQYAIHTMAGEERGVASTKSFSCQALQLYLLSKWLSNDASPVHHSVSSEKIGQVIEKFSLLETWSEMLVSASSLLVLGRYNGYYAALESALKLTELSQIHTEAFSSGSLKHGPFALLDENMPVIFIHTRDVAPEKTLLSVNEILSRRAPVFLLCPDDIDLDFVHPRLFILTYPDIPSFEFIPPTILLQKLSILLCKKKGLSVDYPRNLAKTVTVE